MGFFARKYWDILLNDVVEFNLQGIYDLNLDLMYIYKVCSSRLHFYESTAGLMQTSLISSSPSGSSSICC